jgi:hypothetical protein
VSGPVHETLDETIDRVAASLTAVPADRGFTERLVARLDGHGRGSSNRWLFAAAAAAAVVVLTVVVSIRREQDAKPLPGVVAAPPVMAPGQRNAPPLVGAEEPIVERTVPAVVPAPAFIDSEVEPPPAIAALAAPEGIDVDTLQLDALHVSPVDVGEIDVASIEIREIGALDEPKE